MVAAAIWKKNRNINILRNGFIDRLEIWDDAVPYFGPLQRSGHKNYENLKKVNMAVGCHLEYRKTAMYR